MEGEVLKWANYMYGWQKRYFVLKEDEITYYDDKAHYLASAENFRGSISISRNASNIQVTGLFITISCINSKEVLYLQFLSELDKSGWLVQIGTSRACQTMAINFPDELSKTKRPLKALKSDEVEYIENRNTKRKSSLRDVHQQHQAPDNNNNSKSTNSNKRLASDPPGQNVKSSLPTLKNSQSGLSLKSADSYIDEDKYHSAPETHDNHKDLIVDEISSIQGHLNQYIAMLDKSTHYIEDIDPSFESLGSGDHNHNHNSNNSNNSSNNSNNMQSKILNLDFQAIADGEIGTKSYQKSCDNLLKSITENLCKIQMLNKEYYDMVGEVERERVIELKKLQDSQVKVQTPSNDSQESRSPAEEMGTNSDNVSEALTHPGAPEKPETPRSSRSEREIKQAKDQRKTSSIATTSPKSDRTPTSPKSKSPSISISEEKDKLPDSSSAATVMTSQSFFNTRQTTFSQVKKLTSDDLVEVSSFLDACRAFAEVYDVIGGTTFAPLKADVLGNVTKLEGKVKEYNVTSLEDIVMHEINNKTTTVKNSGTDALVWLKRGLWLFCQFLTNVVEGEENAQRAFRSSYDTTLAKHHNFVVKRLFSVGLMAFPSWETLLPLFLTHHDKSEGNQREIIFKHLQEYLSGMRPLLEQLDIFYMGHKLAN